MNTFSNLVETGGTIAEEIVEPGLPIVDAHHHLKDLPSVHYMAEELRADVRTHNVRATIYIEGRTMYRRDGPESLRPVGETAFAARVAALAATGFFGECRACAAIIGYADLSTGDSVAAVLDAHVTAGEGRFRGIRQGTYFSDVEEVYKTLSLRPPAGLMADRRFRAGFAQLESRGLTFDAVLFHPQLPELVELARVFPGVRIVLNHMGFPLGIGRYSTRRMQAFAEWKAGMSRLAESPNVAVKIGGFGTPFWGFGFDRRARRPTSDELAQAWRPYAETTIELFGASRCMLESNFPTDRVSCDYPVLWNALKKVTSSCSPAERAALFRTTAATVYRIEPG